MEARRRTTRSSGVSFAWSPKLSSGPSVLIQVGASPAAKGSSVKSFKTNAKTKAKSLVTTNAGRGKAKNPAKRALNTNDNLQSFTTPPRKRRAQNCSPGEPRHNKTPATRADKTRIKVRPLMVPHTPSPPTLEAEDHSKADVNLSAGTASVEISLANKVETDMVWESENVLTPDERKQHLESAGRKSRQFNALTPLPNAPLQNAATPAHLTSKPTAKACSPALRTTERALLHCLDNNSLFDFLGAEVSGPIVAKLAKDFVEQTPQIDSGETPTGSVFTGAAMAIRLKQYLRGLMERLLMPPPSPAGNAEGDWLQNKSGKKTTHFNSWPSGTRSRSQSPPRSFIRRGSVFRRAPLIVPSHSNTTRCTGNSQVNASKMKQISTKKTAPKTKTPPGNPRRTKVRKASGLRGCSQTAERPHLSPRRTALSPGSAGSNGGGANTASRSPKRTRRHRGAYLQALSESLRCKNRL